MKQNKKRNDMKVVGITGGVGSGKSVVMNILKEKYGAEIILADLVAHDLMEPGQQNYLDIVEAFGEKVLAKDKTIDRPALAKLVFGDQEKLSRLNAITHPNVKKEIFRRIQRIKEKGEASFIARPNSSNISPCVMQILVSPRVTTQTSQGSSASVILPSRSAISA